MRPVLPGDVAAAAREIYPLPRSERRARLARLIVEAEKADAFRRATGHAHPCWGTGSLMTAAAGWTRDSEPSFDDDRYCACWIDVLHALIAHRAQVSPQRRIRTERS
jgi:hypothetical protein